VGEKSRSRKKKKKGGDGSERERKKRFLKGLKKRNRAERKAKAAGASSGH